MCTLFVEPRVNGRGLHPLPTGEGRGGIRSMVTSAEGAA